MNEGEDDIHYAEVGPMHPRCEINRLEGLLEEAKPLSSIYPDEATALDNFKQLFSKYNIEYREEQSADGGTQLITEGVGYLGFYTQFDFDEGRNLLKFGAYE